MLYQLEFQVDHLTLPLAYQGKLQGLIYHWLSGVPDVSGFIHDEGFSSLSGRTYKLFCFSMLQGRSRVQNGKITFPQKVSFFLRTADPLFASVLESELKAGQVYELGGQELVLTRIEKEEISISSDQITIRMLSPMTVYSTIPPGKRVLYYNPLDDRFSQQVNENYRRKWESACGEEATDNVNVRAVSVGAKDKCVTRIKGRYITAWGGTYLLKGSPRALEFLYHTGLGAKNSLGFGMFEIIG